MLESLGEPHCWVVPGRDTANDYGFIDASCCQQGELSRPLWPRESIATALAEARAEGRRQGLEEAALVCEAGAKDWIGARAGKNALAFAKVAIRSLATNTPETQKPETGESDR